jgi:predicted kinase
MVHRRARVQSAGCTGASCTLHRAPRTVHPESVHLERVLECIIMIGVPGAGKTSLYRQRFEATHARVEDKRLIDATLASGSSVVVDNTNSRRADRAAIIAIARARGARIVGYFFDVTTRAAVARNAARTGKDKVPNVAIFTVAKRLEPPARDEGFDELFRVQIAGDRTLQIAEM